MDAWRQCWDGTFTYNRCCNNGGASPDGTGDATCWGGDITYANCLCDPPVDCVGAWGACRSDCSSLFTVTTAASDGAAALSAQRRKGRGLACSAADGAKVGCSSGSGDCDLCASGSGTRTGYMIAADAGSSTVGGVKGTFLCSDDFLSRSGADSQGKCESLAGCSYDSGTSVCSGIPTASAMSCATGFTGVADVACPSSDVAFSFSGCDEDACAAIVLGTGVVSDNAGSDGCLGGLRLTTSSDQTCDVKCDVSTHVAQSATVTCAANAAVGDATTGQPTCVARGACSTISCSVGWTADGTATSALCIGSACNVSTGDLDVCCNENTCTAYTFGSGVVADDTGSDGCTVDLVLSTSSDPTCTVKCDVSTHVAGTGTVTCAADASAGAATTGEPTCVPLRSCADINADGTADDAFDCSGGANAIDASPAGITCATDPCTATECCTAAFCTEPSDVTGYTVTNTQLNVATGFSVIVACDTGYESTGAGPAAATCGSSGDYTLSGCAAVVCTQPSDITGYTVLDTQLNVVTGFDVTAACDTGYESTGAGPAAAGCGAVSGDYTLSGCAAVVCTEPAAIVAVAADPATATCTGTDSGDNSDCAVNVAWTGGDGSAGTCATANTCIYAAIGSTTVAVAAGGMTRYTVTNTELNVVTGFSVTVLCDAAAGYEATGAGPAAASCGAASGDYTLSGCTPTLCAVDERVISHACVGCGPGTINVADDDATGTDTTCDDACTAQTGCVTDGATCSTVAGLEAYLVCVPAGGDADYYVDAAGTPVQCTAGTWSPAGEDSVTTCNTCTSQVGCLTDGTTCSAAVGVNDRLICTPAGGDADYYVDRAGTPTQCIAGTYSAAGEDSTTACDDIDECVVHGCATDGNTQNTCTQTSDGTTPALHTYFCACDAGAVGGGEATQCTMCAAGLYQDQPGASSCINCPVGTYVTVPGSIAATDCINCPLGTYNPTPASDLPSACIDCGLGKYNDAMGQDAEADCQLCPLGTYLDATGSVALSDCAARAACSTIACPTSSHVVDSTTSATLCIGVSCDTGGGDLATCCDDRAACSTISCSAGWTADSTAISTLCASSACDVSTNDLDTCCVVLPAASASTDTGTSSSTTVVLQREPLELLIVAAAIGACFVVSLLVVACVPGQAAPGESTPAAEEKPLVQRLEEGIPESRPELSPEVEIQIRDALLSAAPAPAQPVVYASGHEQDDVQST